MSAKGTSLVQPAIQNQSLPVRPRAVLGRLGLLYSPLWICLLLALLIRVWLLIHTGGVIAGDEAMLGIQAEHILLGAHPIYYYAQPYMGSLEAYFAALVFAIFGTSVWSFRAVSIMESLLIVFLTWRLAGALADAAHLPASARRRFMTIAALVAALPPLYDAVQEMRMMGGYIEAFVIAIWLLLAGLRLTQRWRAGASSRELALRWAGIGFLIGLGLWVNPLMVSAIVAVALWIAGFIVYELVKIVRHSPAAAATLMGAGFGARATIKVALKGVSSFLNRLLLVVAAIPAALIGCAPAIDYGVKNHWQNIGYILDNGPAVSGNRLQTIWNVQISYDTCTAPRIIGGALPTEPNVTYTDPHLLTFGLVVGVLCIAVSLATIIFSLFRRGSFSASIRQLTGFPLLFAVCTGLIYVISSNAARTLQVSCGPVDLAGRYATPLLLAIPFFVAAVFTAISTLSRKNDDGQLRERDESKPQGRSTVQRVFTLLPFSKILQAGLLVILIAYLGSQSYAWIAANGGYTFQASGCTIAPANNDPIISYMLKQHIRYVWAHGWLSDPITFKTESKVVTADPRYAAAISRIPEYNLALRHANRPSIITLVTHNDPSPAQLQLLAAHNITYSLGRFYSEPGFDLLVITPLNRSVTVDEANTLTTSPFGHC
jgi:hypothetical protein